MAASFLPAPLARTRMFYPGDEQLFPSKLLQWEAAGQMHPGFQCLQSLRAGSHSPMKPPEPLAAAKPQNGKSP